MVRRFTVIGGLTELTAKRLPAGSRERRDLEQVVHAADRAAALTQQLLMFSRRQVVQIEDLHLPPILRGLESLLRRLIGEHIVLQILVADDLGLVRGNPAQIEQIVMNLALNARDSMPEGGGLTIQADNVQVTGNFAQEQLRLQAGSYVVLSVSDSWGGMAAVTQASIFEPFFTTRRRARVPGWVSLPCTRSFRRREARSTCTAKLVMVGLQGVPPTGRRAGGGTGGRQLPRASCAPPATA